MLVCSYTYLKAEYESALVMDMYLLYIPVNVYMYISVAYLV